MVRFVPAADYHGTPGSLTVYLADNSVNLDTAVSGTTTSGTTYDITNATYGGTGDTGAWTASGQTLRTTVTAVNDAPTATATTLAATTEDLASPAGATISSLGFGYSDATDNQTSITGGASTATAFGGIAIVGNLASSATQGVWQYSTNSGSSWNTIGDGSVNLGAAPTNTTAILLPTSAMLRFLPNVPDYNGTPGVLSVQVSDQTVAFSASTDISLSDPTTGQWSTATTLATSITAVNDEPVQSGTAPTAISVLEDSANSTAVTLGMGNLAYGPGGGSDEASQTLTYTITVIPAFIQVFKADGTTPVIANDVLSLAELQGLTYKTVANLNGTANLTWTVQDNGGTANGGIDTLNQSLSITVGAVNDIPVQNGTAPTAISVLEDSANSTAVTLGMGNLAYGPGGGSDESSQTLTYTITAIPSFIQVFLANGTTPVIAGDVLSIDELKGLTYKTIADLNGTGSLTWTVRDSGGTANGGDDTLNQSLSITVISVADVINVTSSTANGNYKAGDVITILVQFDENVLVNTTGGTPYLVLETGTTDRNAVYTSGSGTSTLTFTYTVQPGDTTADLDYVSSSSLVLSGGTIKNIATRDATLTLANPGTIGSLGANKAIVIDTTPPSVGPLDITSGTDTGVDDTITKNGNPVLTFTGESGLAISLLGADGTTLLTLGTQYTFVESINSNGTSTYTVTLKDANGDSTDGNQPFGTYITTSPNIGTRTNNGGSVADGLYTIKATDLAGNQSTVGTFRIDTTSPGTSPNLFGPLDITSGTDSGVDDTITKNGNPVLTFTGESGLAISLLGADGTTLLTPGTQYTFVESTNSNGTSTYTVTLIDANGDSTDGNQPFGTYITTSPNIGTRTNNGGSVADGLYTIKATDLAGNQSTVGTFRIDTTSPGTSPNLFGPLDITSDTDSGLDDTITKNGNPVITFTGEAGLQITLFGPDGTLLTLGTQYTVSYSNGTYTVTLLDADGISGNGNQPFGTYFNGTLTGNGNGTSNGDGLYTIKATDLAGNQSTVGSFTIDTTAPSVVLTSNLSTLVFNQTAIITFTFSEVPVGFAAGDITVTTGNSGSISGFTGTADPKVFTAIFTPSQNISTTANISVPAGSYTDIAINPGTAGSATISIDTQGPSLVISSDKPNLEYRQTAIITFTFSDIPSGFDLSDVNLAGGTMDNLVVAPTNPRIYTARFTPTIDFIGDGLISVANGRFTDSSENPGTGGGINPAITIFNRIRGFSATGDNSTNVGQSIGNINMGSGTSVVLYDPLTGKSSGNVVPFEGYTGQVRVSRADTNGDNRVDMVVSPDAGFAPLVKIIDSVDGKTITEFSAYDSNFTGGLYVSVADINHDGFAEIVTGAGAGGGPHVKVFDGRTHSEIASFFAYDINFHGGVSVATFDFNNDGILDVVTGAGPGGGPHVKVFDGSSMKLIKEFMAYDLNFRGGVFVAAGDFMSDGRYEIITGAGAGGGPHVKIWDYLTLNLVAEKMAYDNYTYASGLVVDMLFGGGVRVGLADGNDDGINDLIVGAGPGGGPHVKVLAGFNLETIRNFFSGERTDSRGVFVSQ